MNDHKNHSVLIWDNGLFTPLAQKIAESFGKVVLYNPWQSAFPKTNQTLIGVGLDNITKTNNFWDFVDSSDIIVFPDVYCASESQYLSNKGYKVWASKYGEDLEVYRDKSKEHLKSLGVPIGKYEVIEGMTDLRKYLKEHNNQYVKTNLERGDAETFHAENYALIETRLDQLELDLGAKKTIKKFIVEEAITPAVEVGSDAYCIDGKYPIGGLCGIELKDAAYLAQYKEFSKMPTQITSYNYKIADTLKKYEYRNFISSELRITKDLTPYVCDSTQRTGSPPTELFINMYENLADIIWEGAHGNCIDPVVKHPYGIQAIIKSDWATTHWQVIQMPDRIKDYVKFKYLTKINGESYVIPQSNEHGEIGAVIAIGDSMSEVIDKIKDYADQIKGYQIDICLDAIPEGLEELKKLEGWGLKLIDG